MQIGIKTVSFDGNDVSNRIDDLVEKNSEGTCTSEEMDELVGLLHFRNDHTDGTAYYASWDDREWISEHAAGTLHNSIKDREMEDAHYSIDFDASPFKYINWDAVVEERKNDLESGTLTIGGESTTFYTFDES